jgi:hypothetical protein
MSHNTTQSIRGPLGRIGWRVRALIAECNYVQARLVSLRNTPDAYMTRGTSA